MSKLIQKNGFVRAFYRWMYRSQTNFTLWVGSIVAVPVWIHSLIHFSSRGELGVSTILFTLVMSTIAGVLIGTVVWFIPFFQSIKEMVAEESRAEGEGRMDGK